MKAGTKYKHKDGQIYVLEHLPYSGGWLLVTTNADGTKRQWCEVNKTASGAFGNSELQFEEYTTIEETIDIMQESLDYISNQFYDTLNGPKLDKPELVEKLKSFINRHDISQL